MKLNEFMVGDKVYMPGAVRNVATGRYSTIKYIGDRLTVLQPEYGEEFIKNSHENGFEFFCEMNDCKISLFREIAFDLYTSIRDASEDYLKERTPHMKTAMARLENARG